MIARQTSPIRGCMKILMAAFARSRRAEVVDRAVSKLEPIVEQYGEFDGLDEKHQPECERSGQEGRVFAACVIRFEAAQLVRRRRRRLIGPRMMTNPSAPA